MLPGDETLNGRTQEILNSIVRAYIETGEPVGSRTVSKRRKDGLSPASIRNAMADLADEGYLSQPHTSAGRLPTEKAFRHYVQSLVAGRILAAAAQRVRAELSEVETMEDRIERSSHILTELTQNVGIAAAMPTGGQVLDQIELVALSEGRVLTILITKDRMVRNRVVMLGEQVTQDELVSIRNYVNRNFSGWTLREARLELLRRMDLERATYDAVMRKLGALYEKGLLESDTQPEIHMEGASNLVGIDLHLTREKMRDLLRALEEKQRLVEMLDRFLEEMPGGVQVRVGLEEAHPAMKELALIGITLALPGGLSAKIAVLGPMRMQYEKVMGAVLHIGREFADVDKARSFAAKHLKPGFANLEVVSPENQQTPEVSESDANTPLDPSDLAAITAERDKLQAEVADLQDRMLRRQAEFENFRRRQDRDRSDFLQYAGMEIVREILPILDDFERALKIECPDTEYRKGIELIYQRLVDTVKKMGLEPIETSNGVAFDPNLHQAVVRFETGDAPDNTILEEFQRGYNFKGKLLRPSMVKVAVHPAA